MAPDGAAFRAEGGIPVKHDDYVPEMEKLRLLSARTVARLLDVNVSTVRRWAADGVLERVEIGGTWRIPLESIERLRKKGER